MPLDVKQMMVLQLSLEAVLVFLLLVLLVRSRKTSRKNDPAAMPDTLKNSIERFLAESEKIAAAFAQNLKDKKELSSSLILKLDRRLAEYQTLLRKTEESFAEAKKQASEIGAAPLKTPLESDKANPAAPEVRALVLQLAKKGLSVEEIAGRAKLHQGEVELIIDLERQFSV